MDITWFSKSPIDRKTIINWSPIWHNKTLGTAQNCCQLVKNCGMYDNYALGSPLLRIWLQFQSIYRKNCISTKHFQYTFASDFIWCTRTYLVHLWNWSAFCLLPESTFIRLRTTIMRFLPPRSKWAPVRPVQRWSNHAEPRRKQRWRESQHSPAFPCSK